MWRKQFSEDYEREARLGLLADYAWALSQALAALETAIQYHDDLQGLGSDMAEVLDGIEAAAAEVGRALDLVSYLAEAV